ncbi:MAG TPA: hypothetical protein PLG63_03115 [bacterium]|nr:hypothetical protein [bacterium]
MTEKKCPVCGSNEIYLNIKKRKITDPFGGEREINVNVYSCKICGTVGDFFNENDRIISNAISFLNDKSVKNIIDFLTNSGFKLAAVEKALGLSQRTLTKWKIGATKPSSSSVALLKLIKLFPWLLDVADSKYDETVATRIFIEEFFVYFFNYDKLLTAVTEDTCLLMGKKSNKSDISVVCGYGSDPLIEIQ